MPDQNHLPSNRHKVYSHHFEVAVVKNYAPDDATLFLRHLGHQKGIGIFAWPDIASINYCILKQNSRYVLMPYFRECYQKRLDVSHDGFGVLEVASGRYYYGASVAMPNDRYH
jgi:hypothetical protein